MTGQFIAQKITIGTDLATFDINPDKNTIVKLQIWDFAGEKRFRFFLPNYARGAMGCLLCYDITRYVSFENLVEWYNIVISNAVDPVFILVGGKHDLEEKRIVKLTDAEDFQREYKLDYFFETSSKSGINNRNIFETLTRAILERKNLLL